MVYYITENKHGILNGEVGLPGILLQTGAKVVPQYMHHQYFAVHFPVLKWAFQQERPKLLLSVECV